MATSIQSAEPSVTRPAHSGDEEGVRELLSRFTSAMCAKDAPAVLALFAPGNVMYTLAPPLEHRSGEVLDGKGLEEWFAGWVGPFGFEQRNVQIRASGDVAFAYGLNHMTATNREGHKVDLWFRETFCLERRAGEWKIVHSHESVPFYMDESRKAAVDLKPESQVTQH